MSSKPMISSIGLITLIEFDRLFIVFDVDRDANLVRGITRRVCAFIRDRYQRV